MKTLILTIIISTFTSCGAIKSLNRIKSNTSTNERTNTNEKALKLETYTHAVVLEDSTEQLYKIVIYPLDTFQFSTQHGFKGKATKVELTALTKHRSHQTDNTATTILTDHQKQLSSVKKTSDKSTSLNKTTKRNKSHWSLMLCAVLALAIGILWVIKKLS